MKRLSPKKQKQIALLLIILGGIFIILISIFLYFKVIRGPGFTELIPADSVAAYIEFPTALDTELVQKINAALQIDWNKNILPWASDKAAFVFLTKKEEDPPQKLLPYIFIQVRSSEEAFTFLSRFRNPEHEINNQEIAGIITFHTPALHFAFLSDIAIISASSEGIERMMYEQSSFAPRLTDVLDFKRIRKALREPFFAYAKPQKIPSAFHAYLGTFLYSMPRTLIDFPAIGIAAKREAKQWEGETYIPFEKPLALAPAEEAPYQANLLNYIPEEFNLLLAGNSLPTQIKKTDHFIEDNKTIVPLSAFLNSMGKTSFRTIDLPEALNTIAGKEFVFSVTPSSILFISEIDETKALPVIEKLMAEIKKMGPVFNPAKREFMLKDGDRAFEFIPGEKEMESFETTFQGIPIKGLFFNEKNDGVFVAVHKGKLFATNNLALLQKSLQLTVPSSGRPFLESERYRQQLRPILKNPELLGVAFIPQGVFSFSKRTYADRMEANFMWRPM